MKIKPLFLAAVSIHPLIANQGFAIKGPRRQRPIAEEAQAQSAEIRKHIEAGRTALALASAKRERKLNKRKSK